MKTCEVCNKNEGKYKCPTCNTPYCSIACCKTHKQDPCKPKEILPPAVPQEMQYETAASVEESRLELLRSDKTLKDLLVNPHLKVILKSIDSVNDPEDLMNKAMVEPIFREFTEACLKVLESHDSD